MFFPSEEVVHWYISEAAARSLKTLKNTYEQPDNLFNIKKYIQKQLQKPSRFLNKIYTTCVKIFHNLSVVMKNGYDGYYAESAVYPLANVALHKSLFDTKSLA